MRSFLSWGHLYSFKDTCDGVTADWQWAQVANTLSHSPDPTGAALRHKLPIGTSRAWGSLWAVTPAQVPLVLQSLGTALTYQSPFF